MPPFPKLPLCAFVVAALASAAEHHPSIAPGAREHPQIEEPAGPLPKYDDMTQAPMAASRIPPRPYPWAAIASWEAPTAVLMRRPQMAAILDAAEVGPAGDDHEHYEGSPIRGTGEIALPALQVGPTGDDHAKHAHHHADISEWEGSPDMSLPLTGQAVRIEQGRMTPAISAALYVLGTGTDG